MLVEGSDEMWLDELSIKERLGHHPTSESEVHQVVPVGNAAEPVDLVEALVVARDAEQAEVEVEESFGQLLVPLARHTARIKRRFAFKTEAEDLSEILSFYLHKRSGGVLQQVGAAHFDLLVTLFPRHLQNESGLVSQWAKYGSQNKKEKNLYMQTFNFSICCLNHVSFFPNGCLETLGRSLMSPRYIQRRTSGEITHGCAQLISHKHTHTRTRSPPLHPPTAQVSARTMM